MILTKSAWDTEKTEFDNKFNKVQVDHEFNAASKALRFKKEYPASIQTTLIKSARETITSKYQTDWIDDGKGGKVMVFRDNNGVIQNNPESKLNPFTAEEMLSANLKDVLDSGKQQKGGGQNPKPGNDDIVDIAELGAATTQTQADDLIVKHLLQKGMLRTDPEFAREQAKIREQYKISEKPIR